MSQEVASSSPMPTAGPLIAAMVTCGSSSSLRMRALDHDVAQVVEEVVGQFFVGTEVAEVVLLVERAERGGFGTQVAAGRKAAALAGDDDDAKPVVAADLVENQIELDAHAHVDRVERLRAVQRDETDAGIVRLVFGRLDRPFERLEGEHRHFP